MDKNKISPKQSSPKQSSPKQSSPKYSTRKYPNIHEDIITDTVVTLENLHNWKKKLDFKTLTIHDSKIMKRYGVDNITEYFNIIKENLENNTMKTLKRNYKKNRAIDMAILYRQEKSELASKIRKSIIKLDDITGYNIMIRMITNKETKETLELYTIFKKHFGESTDGIKEYVEDFILKNIVFGIYVNKKLAGIVILDDHKKLKTDFSGDTKIKTFYVQEMIIHPSYRGLKLSKYLLEYCVLLCPLNQPYMAMMTMPTNEPMIKTALSCGFQKQIRPSGDPMHSLLLIRNMDETERKISSKKLHELFTLYS